MDETIDWKCRVKITLIEAAMIKTKDFSEKLSWMLEPLTLATLAGITPREIQVQAIDDRIEAIDYDEPRDLVGISVKTFSARRAYQIAAEFRKRGVPVILGGFHPTLASDEAAQYADAVMIGDAEGAWEHVIDDVANHRLKKIYRQEIAPPLERVTPNRAVFKGKKYLPVSIVETARGCRFDCRFCAVSAFYNRQVRHRPIEEVVAEVAALKHRLVLFADDNIVADHDATKELLRALIPLRIHWIGEASLTATRDLELMRLLQESGCVGLLLGFESLSPAGLEHINKSWNMVNIGFERAVSIMHDHGIAILGSFILGTDDDTVDSVDAILDFAIRQKLFASLFNMLIAYPGTVLYDDLKAQGRLVKPEWWLDPAYTHGSVMFQPKRMSIEQVEQGWLKLNREFYGVRSTLKRFWEPRANARDLWRMLAFLVLNLSAYNEEMRRYRKPLGAS